MGYEPVFYFASDNGPAYRERFRWLTNGRLEKVKYQNQNSHLYYSEQAAQLLKDKGYDDKGWYLLDYIQNQGGRAYLFENIAEGQLSQFEVLLLEQEDGPLKKFLLPQQGRESPGFYGMDEGTIYLWRSTQSRFDIIQISRADGTIQIQSMDESLLRLARQRLYDPVRNRMLFLNTAFSEKSLNCYSFETGQLKTVELEKPATWILIGEQGYLLVNDTSANRIVFYPYDWQLNPMEPILIQLGGQRSRLGSWVDQYGRRDMVLEDGIVYGGIQWEKAIWYYVLDLEEKRPVGLWEIRPPAGKLRLIHYRLFRQGEAADSLGETVG